MNIDERLEKIESMLAVLVDRQTIKDWYTTEEFARLAGKAEFTVREWCRFGRVRAEKNLAGAAKHAPHGSSRTMNCYGFQREGIAAGSGGVSRTPPAPPDFSPAVSGGGIAVAFLPKHGQACRR